MAMAKVDVQLDDDLVARLRELASARNLTLEIFLQQVLEERLEIALRDWERTREPKMD